MPPKDKGKKKPTAAQEQELLEEQKRKEEEEARLVEEERKRQELEAIALQEEEIRRSVPQIPTHYAVKIASLGWKEDLPPPRYQHVGFLHPYASPAEFIIASGTRKEGPLTAHSMQLKLKKWRKLELSAGGRALIVPPQDPYAEEGKGSVTGPPPRGTGPVVPESTMGQSSFVCGPHLYTYGGHGARGFSPLMHRLNTETWKWEAVDFTGEAPQFYLMSCVYHEPTHTALFFGGRSVSQTISDGLFEFDVRSSHWTSVKAEGQPPSARFGHAAVLYGECPEHYGDLNLPSNSMIIHGGLDTLASFEPTPQREPNSTVFSFNLRLRRWSKIDMPAEGTFLKENRLYGHSLTPIKTRGMLLAGGNGNQADSHMAILRWDFGRWEMAPLLGEVLPSRSFHSAVHWGEQDSVLVYGGQNRRENRELGDFYVLTLIDTQHRGVQSAETDLTATLSTSKPYKRK